MPKVALHMLPPVEGREEKPLDIAISDMSWALRPHLTIVDGSVGMEGAYDAMGSGQVDLNWAKEHHDLWVEEVEAKAAAASAGEADARAQPAE